MSLIRCELSYKDLGKKPLERSFKIYDDDADFTRFLKLILCKILQDLKLKDLWRYRWRSSNVPVEIFENPWKNFTREAWGRRYSSVFLLEMCCPKSMNLLEYYISTQSTSLQANCSIFIFTFQMTWGN